MNNLEYKESQNFLTLWSVGLFVILLGREVYSAYEGYSTLGAWSFAVSFWILVGVVIIMLLIRLSVRINSEGIIINFIPFVFRKVWKWEEIGEVSVKEYSWLDYGGWGYRIGKNGVAYTTKGKQGIHLVLKNGGKILIGTQKPEEVTSIISNFKKGKDEF